MTVSPYLTAADLRAAAVLDRMDRFSDDLLEGLVSEFEEIVEGVQPGALGAAFTPRTATAKLRGHTGCTLTLPHPLLRSVTSVTIDGRALSAGALAALKLWNDEGVIERSSGWCGTQIVVVYAHGADAPSAGLLRACREFVRARATRTAGNAPRDAAGPAGVDGTTYPTAKTVPTGVKAADDIIAGLRSYRVPGIA